MPKDSKRSTVRRSLPTVFPHSLLLCRHRQQGGDVGGQEVATGKPEQVAEVPASHTGRYLRKVLAQHQPAESALETHERHRFGKATSETEGAFSVEFQPGS